MTNPKIDRWADNAEAHQIINECLVSLAERLKKLEEYVVHIPTPDKILYKPKGEEEYLSLKENYDLIYKSIEELRNGMQD